MKTISKKHVYVRDIKDGLKSSFINKHGKKVELKDVLNDLAVEHISAPAGRFTEELCERLYDYLDRQTAFVHLHKLERKMIMNGYKVSEVKDAIKWILNRADVQLNGTPRAGSIRLRKGEGVSQEDIDAFDRM